MLNDPHEIVLSSRDAATLHELLRARSPTRSPTLPLEQLASLLRDARICAPEYLPAERVRIGSTVTYLEEPAGVRRKVTLADPNAAPGGLDRLSALSPPGLALLGRKPGSLVMSALPNGWPFSVQVLDVAVTDEMEAT